ELGQRVFPALGSERRIAGDAVGGRARGKPDKTQCELVLVVLGNPSRRRDRPALSLDLDDPRHKAPSGLGKNVNQPRSSGGSSRVPRRSARKRSASAPSTIR